MAKKQTRKAYFSHVRALVDRGARIGRGTRIWAFAHVMSGAEIGEDCNIGDYAFVESGAKLGNGVTVKNGVQVWEGVMAENGVFLGPNSVLTNDLLPRAFRKRPKEEWLEATHIKEGATIGANATIICGVTIGRFAFIAAGAVVTDDVADFALVVGMPARRIGWVCECGERLDARHVCRECGKRYRAIGSKLMARR